MGEYIGLGGGLQSIAIHFICWWDTFWLGWIYRWYNCLQQLGQFSSVSFGFSGERVSALVMTSVDPGILQTALLQVAEATRAASEAAKAVQQAQAKAGALGPSSAASSTNVDWSKLINKPQAFDHASLEAEIKAFPD